jgi:hypothetical protein
LSCETPSADVFKKDCISVVHNISRSHPPIATKDSIDSTKPLWGTLAGVLDKDTYFILADIIPDGDAKITLKDYDFAPDGTIGSTLIIASKAEYLLTSYFPEGGSFKRSRIILSICSLSTGKWL